MPAAARQGDNHSCQASNPDGSSHTGGLIQPPVLKSVIIGGMPAVTVNCFCTCVGPPDTIKKGSSTVTIHGQAAARKGDMTAHLGRIISGCETVIIGG